MRCRTRGLRRLGRSPSTRRPKLSGHGWSRWDGGGPAATATTGFRRAHEGDCRPGPRYDAEGKDQRLRAYVDCQSERDDRAWVPKGRDADDLPEPAYGAADRRPRELPSEPPEVASPPFERHASGAVIRRSRSVA